MTAHRPDLAASTGCRWLMLAAEMAGLLPDSSRSSHPARTGWECPPQIATCGLSTEARSVPAARDFTLATLLRWGAGYSGYAGYNSQDIAVVVSELVTNAVRHARPGAGANGPPGRVRLGLLQYRPWLLCAVADPSKATPVPRAPGFLAETGRGLQMIRALSDQWGYTQPGDAGKIVWAVFAERQASPSRTRACQAATEPRDSTLTAGTSTVPGLFAYPEPALLIRPGNARSLVTSR